LGDADLLVLWSCAGGAERGVPQNLLVDEVGLSPAQTSGLLDRLRQRGLVTSRRPAQDRRRQLWRLEPDGRRLLGEALTRIAGLAESALLPLSCDEQSTLELFLEAVARAARGEAPPVDRAAPRDADAASDVAGEAA
jgi:DNA-binding MarR family transcriptional regulator